jgi:thiamine biosynthesis lipoprotein
MKIVTTQGRILVEDTQRIMATQVSAHVAVAPKEEATARAAIAACMDWMREVERRLTRFDAASDLSQLNQAAGRWQHVSEMLFTAVRAAIAAAEASNGLFDPTILPQLEALGYDRDFSQLSQSAPTLPPRRMNSALRAEDQQVPGGLPGGTFRPGADLNRRAWQEIELERRRRRIRLPAGVRLDLGGIAKGWAADQALKAFFGAFANVIVNVGGDLRLRGGPQPEEDWSVGIRDPQMENGAEPAPDRALIRFAQGGLATSGATRRWWYQGGQRQHHLLDPRTGRPAQVWLPPGAAGEGLPGASQLIATATALAPTAARAEVAAKVALLRGYPLALHAIEAAWNAPKRDGVPVRADEGVALLLILGDGQVVLSSNMNAYLEHQGGGDIWA